MQTRRQFIGNSAAVCVVAMIPLHSHAPTLDDYIAAHKERLESEKRTLDSQRAGYMIHRQRLMH